MAGSHLVHELENPAAAAGGAGQWIVRHDDGQSGFLRQELVDVAQQSAAAMALSRLRNRQPEAPAPSASKDDDRVIALDKRRRRSRSPRTPDTGAPR